MNKSILMAIVGAFIAVTTAFAPAANAGGYYGRTYYKPHYSHHTHYVYVPSCKLVYFQSHYGHGGYYKKVCH